MNDLFKLSIKPTDYPTATELSLLASDLAIKGFIQDPRHGLESALALWESSFILLRHHKQERAKFNDFLSIHSDGVPEWPDPTQIRISFKQFSTLISNNLNEQAFSSCLECFFFFFEFGKPWRLEEVFNSKDMTLKFDKRKGRLKYTVFEELVTKHNIPKELEAIYATYLFIEAQRSGTDFMKVDPVTISSAKFTLSNLNTVRNVIESMKENGIYNDQYEDISIPLYHLSRFCSEVQKHLSNSKKTSSKQIK